MSTKHCDAIGLILGLTFFAGLQGFIPVTESWQMPLWLAISLTTVGGIGSAAFIYFLRRVAK